MKTSWRRAVACAGLTVASGGGMSVVTAHGQAVPPEDHTAIWTLQDENSSLSSAHLTDRYYTNGIKLGFTSGTGALPDFLADFAHGVFGAGQQRLSVDITQQIYTPTDTESANPPLGDRPYAGLLLANLAIVQDSADTRSTLGLSLGLLGPDAQGERVQNGFHDLIGQGHNNGWRTELHDEPVFELYGGRTLRVPLGRIGGVEIDALPSADVGLGTLRIYGQVGAQLRLGQGLDSDFGTARLRPGLTGGDAFAPTKPFVWYVFAGSDGQVVGRDVTLDGNTWRNSRNVSLNHLVGEFQGGAAIEAFGMRLAYTHVLQTSDYKIQKGGLHQFGSLALSVRF